MPRPAVAVLLLALLAGCVAPPADEEVGAASAPPPGEPPLLALPETVAGLRALATVGVGNANDLAFHGPHVYVATFNNGMHVVDASDPSGPVELASVPCNGKDIGVVSLPGARIVTISSQGDDGCPDAAPSGGIRLVNVTDPANPVVLGQVPLKYGSHTHTPYGDTGLIYNSAYNLASDPTASPMDHHRAEIVDVSDPLAPKVVGEFLFPDDSTSIGCHDILAEPERGRAICAAISETMVWDLADPLSPKVVSTIRNPALTIHHSAATLRNGTLLALGDEWAGVLAPGCHPAGTAPTGAIWLYDLSDPAAPEALGFVPPPPGAPGTVCTAHNFNAVEGRDLLVAGFYAGGTMLIDVSDPASPKVLDRQAPSGGSAWAAYHHAGVVFTGDTGNGLQLYALADAPGGAPPAPAAAPRLLPAAGLRAP